MYPCVENRDKNLLSEEVFLIVIILKPENKNAKQEVFLLFCRVQAI
jgi:hypothetical protein